LQRNTTQVRVSLHIYIIYYLSFQRNTTQVHVSLHIYIIYYLPFQLNTTQVHVSLHIYIIYYLPLQRNTTQVHVSLHIYIIYYLPLQRNTTQVHVSLHIYTSISYYHSSVLLRNTPPASTSRSRQLRFQFFIHTSLFLSYFEFSFFILHIFSTLNTPYINVNICTSLPPATTLQIFDNFK
jgi:hypothetical protein